MYLIDSCIFIEFLRGRLPHTLAFLQSSSPEFFNTSAVVKAELLTGAAKSNKQKENTLLVERLLFPFKVLPFNEQCATEYATIRTYLEKKGLKIGANDLLIAATALAFSLTLVTQNVSEFSRIPHLKVEDWDEVNL